MSVKAASSTRCYNHPHRSVSQRCSRCGLHYCDECLSPVSKQLLCPSCRQELAEAQRIREEAKVPFLRRLRESLIRIAVMAVIVAVVIGGMGIIATRLFARPLTEEEFNRIRDAYEIQMGDINWLAGRKGGRVVQVTGEQPGYEARLLIDGYAGADFRGWRSRTSSYPQEITFAISYPRSIRVVRVLPDSDAPSDSWAREVEVFRASEPNGPWESVGRGELLNNDSPEIPSFAIGESSSSPAGLPLTQYIKIVVYSNWGSPSYVSLGEIQASGM